MTSIVNLAIVIVVTRGLDSKAAGAVFALTSVYFIAETVVRLGTDGGIVHFVATRRVTDENSVADVIWASFLPLIPAMLIGAVVVGVLTPIVVDSLGNGALISHVGVVAVLLAVAVPVGATYDFMTATTRGLGASRPTVLIERTLRPLLQVGGVAAVVIAGGGSDLVVLAWVLPYAVTAPIMALLLRSLLRSQNLLRRPAGYRSVFSEVWRFTLPRSFTAVLQILLQRLDIVIVGALLGARPAAIYTGATRFVVVVQLGNQAIGYFFQPQFAGLMSRKMQREARELLKVSTVWLVSISAPLALSVCVTSPILVKILGPRYHEGIAAMIIVTAAGLVGSACGPVDYVLITVGRTSWTLGNTVLALTINMTIDLVFIPQIGINAAAIGWAAAIFATNILPVIQVKRALGFTPFSALWLRMVAVSGLAFGVIPGIALFVAGASLPVMAVTLTVTSAAYLVLVWRWRDDLALSQLVRTRK